MYKPLKKAETQKPAMAILDRQEIKEGGILTGKHETLEIVRSVFFSEDFILECKDISGKFHKDSFFVKNKRGTGWSYKMCGFLAALLPDLECQKLLLTSDKSYIEKAFVGLKFGALVKCGEGYSIATNGIKYFAVDAVTGASLSEEFNRITDVRQWALDKGLQQAFPKLEEIDAHKFMSYNLELFKHGIYTAKK